MEATTKSIINNTLVIREKAELPDEIWMEIFQFLECEKDGRNLLLTSKQFRNLELSCSPYLNIMNIAFNLNCYGLTQFDTPSLIQGEKLPLFTNNELSRIRSINEQNNSISNIFLSNNKTLPLELVNQIVKCANWELEKCQTFLPTLPLAKLCNQLLEGYSDQEKAEINKNEFLVTALFNTTFKGKLTWKHLMEKKRETELSSKIDMMIAIANDVQILMFESLKLKEDREFMLAIVKQNGLALQHATSNLKKDKEIVMAGILDHSTALYSADIILKKDREFVLAAIKLNSHTFKYVDESLKNDKEFVLEAVKLNGLALKHVSVSQKKDKEIVLVALKQNKKALEFADESLENDKEVLLAVKS